jgi:hypothetical protein
MLEVSGTGASKAVAATKSFGGNPTEFPSVIFPAEFPGFSIDPAMG